MIGDSLIILLHVLVPIYWLGGDLGAFYSSYFLIDPKRSVGERMMALKLVNNIDMAPRTAMIMAIPTGLTAAAVRGWLPIGSEALVAIWVAGLIWLALAWAVHVRHDGTGKLLARIDLIVRVAVIVALLVLGIGGVVRDVAIPMFIALKLLALATCIILGLVIRLQLKPLIPIIGAMATSGPTPQSDAALASVLARARISVVAIWCAVLVACYLGIAMPV
ncbi:hypothetical protein [Sphingosinithalassobacter portus]|uniref:hypothetical protein n=1 Tax=Stakelama portus TaxID=2676234 RepID=UPI000D6E1001|nr:hypothetical protein [Sphingosinithalassobacter portus]